MSALFFLKDQLTLLALLVLILLILAVLALVIRAATRADADSATRRITPRLRSDSLRNSFRQAVDLIEAHIASRSQRYTLPWVLVLEEGNERSPLPLGQAGVASALGVDATESVATPGLKWNFFDKGIVVGIQGSYLQGGDDAGDADKPWDEFLGLCREYRPERPFDALVVTVPASLLLDTRADAQLALSELAKQANRRLWLAQNRFAMRFGLYVVVSDCEHIPGFPAYARALPELQSGGMLGWSSPYDLNTNYRQEWVGEAMRQTCRTLVDSSAELFASLVDDSSAASYFLLPSRIEAMQPQLQLYIDELMRPSSYHEPFILRGLYFSGDASEAAEQLALGQDSDADSTALLDTVRRPVFLRDIFEQKVFAEIGLTRPSNNQLLSRPMLNGVLRWSAVGVAVVWLGGVAVGSVALHHQVAQINEVLARLQRDAEIQNGASRRGAALSSNWQRDRTLNLLQLMEDLNDMRLWSVFMPGSWPVFDSLSQRLNGLLEQSFFDIAVGTLRQGLYDQARNLTGASQDPSTGELIAGLSCAPAADRGNNDEGKPATTLGYEDLPEFAQLLSYLSAAEQLDQASQALRRLLDPRLPYAGRDLSLVVRVVLGVELPLTKNLDASLFRSENAQKQGLNLLSMQAALRCSLQQKIRTLNARAFDNNPLLSAERQLNLLLKKVDSQDGGDAPGGRLQVWQDMFTQLESIDGLLKQGGGAWLRKPSFQPGQSWDRSLSRIANVVALGSDTAHALQDESDQSFRRFRTALDEAGNDLPSGLRVVWNDKEGRWEMSKGLADLHSALQVLLGQPWMSRNGTRSLGAGSDPLISWDVSRLDQALAVADLRKRFQAEQLARFPAELQGAVEKLVNQQLAQQVSEHLAYALTPGAKAINDPTRLEAERGRLARIQMLLSDLGDQRLGETLSALQRQDANARLRALDQALERAELYAPQGRGFSAWNGGKGPTLAAYALGDGAGLSSYLAQQRSRIESLGREAELLLPSGGSDGSAGTDRWHAIVRDLERYRLKNPNSNLLALENFLTAMAGDVDAGNCLDRISSASTGYQSGDYFGQRQMQLTFALQQRCRELHSREQARQWAQFQSQFKRTAAGRPPFAAPGWDYRAPAMEVDELPALLASFEQAQRGLRENGNGGRQSPLRQFMDQFERARSFLAPLQPAEEGAASGYDIAVEFRANRQGEQEGNKIIEWAIEIGNQQLNWHDTPRALRWQPGMPITLQWRLAKDGPAMPKPDFKQPALSVAERSVALSYTDPWALMNLLGRHREAEVGTRTESRGQLLRFEFPLSLQAEKAGAPATDSRARVFLRLTISPAGKRTPLAWPGAFPTRAPDVSL